MTNTNCRPKCSRYPAVSGTANLKSRLLSFKQDVYATPSWDSRELALLLL